MPTELEELVEFLHHGNTRIRQIAIENLLGYSSSNPTIFKTGQLSPIKDLKLLVKDYIPIAKNALTILINLSDDRDVLTSLAEDDAFLDSLLHHMSNPAEPNANLICMLLANLVKSDHVVRRIMTLERDAPSKLSKSTKAVDHLMDSFVKGAEGGYNQYADFDYLAYVFADLAKRPEGRAYFVTAQPYDSVIPLTKLIVFTEHKSEIRRRGVASTIKNVTFDVPSHPLLLSPEGINLLPYILLPLTGSEDYAEEESLAMPPDLQLLPPDKMRDSDPSIMVTHLETLLLLTSGSRAVRDQMRDCGVYYPVRETHLRVEDEGVREACDRLVQVLMGNEPGEGDDDAKAGGEHAEDDEDHKVVEIF